MTRALVRLALALAFVLAPASAGASAATARPVAVTAAPARLGLTGSGSAVVRLRNAGTTRVAVEAARAGFALDLHGRPHIAGGHGVRSAARWLTLQPAHLTLNPHASARLTVSARVPPRAAPGDHDALVVLTARPLAGAEVSVRLRLGVVVVVRAPGAVVRRLELRRLRVVRRRGTRMLRLVAINAGNVMEPLRSVRAVISSVPTGRRFEALVARPRELRPRTRGVLEFRLRTRARGIVTASFVVPAEPGRDVIRRTFRVRL